MPPSRPTEAELEILAVLWRDGDATVRTVHDIVAAERGTGYTSTLKLMQLMREKGMIERISEERPHRYRASEEPDATRQQILTRLIDRLFAGSTSALVQQALGAGRMDAAELDRIRSLLDEHANKQQRARGGRS